MYEEKRIFGPLTFRQFLYVLAFGGIAYIAWKNVVSEVALLVVVLIVLVSIPWVIRMGPIKIEIKDLPKYFKNKRAELGEDEYKKWLKKRVANIAAQIAIRKERGLVLDENLENLLKIYESETFSLGIDK